MKAQDRKGISAGANVGMARLEDEGSGNIIFLKMVGRLDHSAVSANGAKMALKSNEKIALQVRSFPPDTVDQ